MYIFLFLVYVIGGWSYIPQPLVKFLLQGAYNKARAKNPLFHLIVGTEWCYSAELLVTNSRYQQFKNIYISITPPGALDNQNQNERNFTIESKSGLALHEMSPMVALS